MAIGGNQLFNGASGPNMIGYIFSVYTQDRYKSGGGGTGYLYVYTWDGSAWVYIDGIGCGYNCQNSGPTCIYLEEGALVKVVYGRQYSPNGAGNLSRGFCYTKPVGELTTNTGFGQYGLYGFYAQKNAGQAAYEVECTFTVNQYAAIQDGYAACP